MKIFDAPIKSYVTDGQRFSERQRDEWELMMKQDFTAVPHGEYHYAQEKTETRVMEEVDLDSSYSLVQGDVSISHIFESDQEVIFIKDRLQKGQLSVARSSLNSSNFGTVNFITMAGKSSASELILPNLKSASIMTTSSISKNEYGLLVLRANELSVYSPSRKEASSVLSEIKEFADQFKLRLVKLFVHGKRLV